MQRWLVNAYQVWEPLPGPICLFPLKARAAAITRSAIAAFTLQSDAFARMEEWGTLRYDEEHLFLMRAFDAA